MRRRKLQTARAGAAEAQAYELLAIILGAAFAAVDLAQAAALSWASTDDAVARGASRRRLKERRKGRR